MQTSDTARSRSLSQSWKPKYRRNWTKKISRRRRQAVKQGRIVAHGVSPGGLMQFPMSVTLVTVPFLESFCNFAGWSFHDVLVCRCRHFALNLSDSISINLGFIFRALRPFSGIMEFAGLLERAMAVSFAISEVCTLVWAHAEVHSYAHVPSFSWHRGLV